jgi:carbonic anhydrase
MYSRCVQRLFLSLSPADNTLFFWKYPEEEEKNQPPCFQISLHNCVTENVTLAPRDICSRMNTFMLENQRPVQHDDRESQNIHVVSF